jgi:hypothetical protein
MFRWLYALPHLLAEAGAVRRDARIRFLKGQIDILRPKLGGRSGGRAVSQTGRPSTCQSERDRAREAPRARECRLGLRAYRR